MSRQPNDPLFASTAQLLSGVGLVLAGLCAGCAQAPEPGDAPRNVEQWFTEITAEVGLDFNHESGAAGGFHLPEIMSSGAALFDYDQDGDLDIYLTNGNAGERTNRLLRQDADGRFVDATAESGLGDGGYGMGVAIGDIDNDGMSDVYVTSYGDDRLYRNLGGGRFEDVSANAGIDVPGWSTSAAFFDYDRDGYLDLYVARYLEYDENNPCFDPAGRRDYCSPAVFPPTPDVLLRNNRNGTFTDVSRAAGIAALAGTGLGVVCDDLDGDGWPDVYVANDGYPNQVWMNRGDGTFVDRGVLMGGAYNSNGDAEAGMGVLAADIDNDADMDLFMTHLREESNTLLRNLGGARGFVDATSELGLGPSSMRYTGFGTAAFDVELDGDLDLVVANGRVQWGDPHPDHRLASPWDAYAEQNLFYLNDAGRHFERIVDRVAAIVAPVEISRGLAAGDVDSDGDVDLLLSNVQGPARLYRNDAPRDGHWLKLRAFDPRLERDAIGARIEVQTDLGVVTRTVSRGYSYQSSSAVDAHFGIGSADRIEHVRIRWPDGLVERFDADVDQATVLVRGNGRPDGQGDK